MNMTGLKLRGFGKNDTVRKQVRRGKGEKNPYNSPDFISENRISIDFTYMFDTPEENSISKRDVESLIPRILNARDMLDRNEGDIFDHNIPMTGWRNLPDEISKAHLDEILNLAGRLAGEIDAFVSLGIGGSYLGIEATFRALTHNYFNQLNRDNRGGAPEIYFLGQNMDPDYFRDTLDMLEGKRIGVNVISKSGTTTETAIAFRIIQRLIEDTWGEKAPELIIATTDRVKGALKTLADRKGYRTFVIPDNIGGRFSVLTNVGLVGLAMANIDIHEFVAGFKNMKEIITERDFWNNPALLHAALRHIAWTKGKKIEVVATNSNSLYPVARWMEQLFPESEGHEGHGMWISPSLYSEKLHANGQMVQQGERDITETFLLLGAHDNRVTIPEDEDNLDGLNFMPEKGFDMNYVNRKVIEGPAYAHYLGGVPNMTIEIPRRNAFNLGQFYYMMEESVAISGFLLGHNPFIQPGVEAYKKAMFAMLERPGYEDNASEMKDAGRRLEKVIVDA